MFRGNQDQYHKGEDDITKKEKTGESLERGVNSLLVKECLDLVLSYESNFTRNAHKVYPPQETAGFSAVVLNHPRSGLSLARESSRSELEIKAGLKNKGYLLTTSEQFAELLDKMERAVLDGSVCLPLARSEVIKQLTRR